MPFLVELGVMTHDGKVRTQRYAKFRQVNRFLELVDAVLPQRALRIVDFGSGKSYLTFALYHLLAVERGLDVEVVGYDAQVIEFIDLDHTAKNLLIRAVRRRDSVDGEAMERYRVFKERLGIDPALERALADMLPA